MGKLFINYFDESEKNNYYYCVKCNNKDRTVHLFKENNILSFDFTRNRNRTFLIDELINCRVDSLKYVKSSMGSYEVSKMYCKFCNTELGFKYIESLGNISDKFRENKYIISLNNINYYTV